MFRFGRKQSGLDDRQKMELAHALAKMLSKQLLFAKADPADITEIESAKGRINQQAIGYIYGFIDCALQSRRVDTLDVAASVPIVYHVMQTLFPGQEHTYTNYLLEHASDGKVVLGMMKGGQQYSQFIAKPGNKGAPMGLASFILDENEARASDQMCSDFQH